MSLSDRQQLLTTMESDHADRVVLEFASNCNATPANSNACETNLSSAGGPHVNEACKEDLTEELDHDYESFISLIVHFQSKRLNDQRCSVSEDDDVNELSSCNSEVRQIATHQHAALFENVSGTQDNRSNDQHHFDSEVEDPIFEMVLQSQAARINDQRSAFSTSLSGKENLSK